MKLIRWQVMSSIQTIQFSVFQKAQQKDYLRLLCQKKQKLQQRNLQRILLFFILETLKALTLSRLYIQRLIVTKSKLLYRELLRKMLRNVEFPLIIFVNTRENVDSLYKFIKELKYRVLAFHGGKGQQARENALFSMKQNNTDILIATDLAARGLDIPDLKHVINFDCPLEFRTYKHRIGRTARAGKSGMATTFLTNEDSHIFADLVGYLDACKMNIPEDLKTHPASQGSTFQTITE